MYRAYLTKAILYLLLGIWFIYFGIQSKGDTVWNSITLIFAAVAALNFLVALRMFRFYFKFKGKK